MTEPKETVLPEVPREATVPKNAFDAWLERGLHQLFDDIAKQPVPEELLRLIEGDRKK